MDWILIGIVAGSLVTGTFTAKEACLGRAAMLKELKIEAKCVEAPRTGWALSSSGSIQLTQPSNCCRFDGSGICGPCADAR
jgi:hypothetical protein